MINVFYLQVGDVQRLNRRLFSCWIYFSLHRIAYLSSVLRWTSGSPQSMNSFIHMRYVFCADSAAWSGSCCTVDVSFSPPEHACSICCGVGDGVEPILHTHMDHLVDYAVGAFRANSASSVCFVDFCPNCTEECTDIFFQRSPCLIFIFLLSEPQWEYRL